MWQMNMCLVGNPGKPFKTELDLQVHHEMSDGYFVHRCPCSQKQLMISRSEPDMQATIETDQTNDPALEKHSTELRM